jgi:hypothetical protein
MNICDKQTWEALTFLVSQETQESLIGYLCTALGVSNKEEHEEIVTEEVVEEEIVSEAPEPSQDYLVYLQEYLQEHWVEVSAVAACVAISLLIIGIWLIKSMRAYVSRVIL